MVSSSNIEPTLEVATAHGPGPAHARPSGVHEEAFERLAYSVNANTTDRGQGSARNARHDTLELEQARRAPAPLPRSNTSHPPRRR